MRSNLKGIYEEDIESYSCVETGNIRHDYRVQLKNGKEIKVKRRIGKFFDMGHKWNKKEKL